jgi:hypothetical protein
MICTKMFLSDFWKQWANLDHDKKNINGILIEAAR